MDKPRALLISPEAPYPLNGGGALRTASVLGYLAQGYSVDAIVFRQNGARVELPSGLVDRLMTVELPRHSRDHFARVLRNGLRLLRRTPPLVDRFSGFGSEIAELLRDRRGYELGVVEHFWCAPYHLQIAPKCQRTVLDLHNVESVWHEGCARVSSGLHARAHGVFARAAAELERVWLPRYSTLLVPSLDDALRVQKIMNAPQSRRAEARRQGGSPDPTIVYPNAIPFRELPRRAELDCIVFSGTFDYEPNRLAVRHFAQRIWPGLRERWPKVKWRLVGRGSEAIDWVTGDPRVECTGPVDDPLQHLAVAKVAIAPILSGSGTRLKIIEAWAAGTAVVSTTLGAEGLPARDGENILLADDPEGFASAVSRLLESPSDRERLGANGRRIYEQQLTWEAAWKILDACMLNPEFT